LFRAVSGRPNPVHNLQGEKQMRINRPRLRMTHVGSVVFGLDRSARARAAWFDSDERLVARTAAERSGFSCIELSTGSTAWLPGRRRLESGRMIIPRVRLAVLERLIDLEDRQLRSPHSIQPTYGDEDIGDLTDALLAELTCFAEQDWN
jgi:hypothetical protein